MASLPSLVRSYIDFQSGLRGKFRGAPAIASISRFALRAKRVADPCRVKNMLLPVWLRAGSSAPDPLRGRPQDGWAGEAGTLDPQHPPAQSMTETDSKLTISVTRRVSPLAKRAGIVHA